MNPYYTNFADYQAHYENAIVPVIVQDSYDELKSSFHHAVIIIDGWIQGPDLFVKIAQIGTTVLSFIPSVAPILEGPKAFCYDAKLMTNLVKGFRSIDSLLNITFAWKAVVVQISSLTLFAVNILAFVDRFGFFQVTAIKVTLAAIPIVGVLPFGGLLVISLGALSGMLLLFSIDKKNNLELEEKRMIDHKLTYWSQPLDLQKVEQKQAKFAKITQELKDEITIYEAILEEGRRVEAGLIVNQNVCKNKHHACQKAIRELSAFVSSKQKYLAKREEKYGDWNLLKAQWSTIDQNELERFRKAKENKWAAKLNRLRFEQKANLFSMASSAFLLSKQIITLSVALSNRTFLPMGVHVTLEIVGTTCGLTNFFMKRILQNRKIPPVELGAYLSFDCNVPETQAT